MKRLRSGKARITASLGLVVLFIGIVFFLLRGPYLSNTIKRMIIPALENVTRESIIIDKAVINLFPFYVQAKGVKLFDKDGNRLLWITKTRAYIDLLGLLSNEIRIRKLTLLEPDLSAGKQDIIRIMNNVRGDSDIGKGGKFRVVLKSMKVTDGNVIYSDSSRKIGISGSGLLLELDSRDMLSAITVSMKNSTVTLPSGAELDAAFSGRIKMQDGSIEVVKASIDSSGSTLDMNGRLRLSPDNQLQDGTLSGKARVLAGTFRKVFGVASGEEGRVDIEGSVHMIMDEQSGHPQFNLDLKTDSQFYLETLMEILNVNENIKGKVSFTGTVSGIFPDIKGRGRAKLENAVFDTLPISFLEGDVRYEERTFSLDGFRADAFNGAMRGNAHIQVPGGDYAVEGEVSNLFSPEFFQFIHWRPPLPEGALNGKFNLIHNRGEAIQVAANVTYINGSGADGDVLNRVKTASTALTLREGLLTLTGAEFVTDRSALSLDGTIDLQEQRMDLALELASDDASDLSAPYYDKLIAPARFSGKAAGSLSAPLISGKLVFNPGTVHGHPFSVLSADVIYSIQQLSTRNVHVEQEGARFDISGTIDFRKSQQLFSFLDPYFRLNATVSRAPLGQIMKAFYKEVPVHGMVDGTASCTGGIDDFVCTADAGVTGSSIFGQAIDHAEIHALIDPEKVNVKVIDVKRGGSRLSGSGILSYDKQYKIDLSSDRILLHDVHALAESPVDASFALTITGSGTLDRPAATFSLDVHESSLKGQQAGAGTVTGSIEGEMLQADGMLADGRIRAHYEAEFPRFQTWSLSADFEEAGYNFLLTGFLKQVPDNFLISGKGNVGASYSGGTLSVRSRFSSLGVNLYDYTLKNTQDVVVDLKDADIAIRSFVFRGKNSELSLSGALAPGERYDLSVKANVHLAPLQAITDTFASLDGRAIIDGTIKGVWERPEITGLLTFENAFGVHAAQAQKIGPVNGTFLLRKERISFDSVSVGYAGGALVLSGMGHISGFKLDKLFLSSSLKDITIRPSEGMTADIGGRVFYEYSGRGSALSGTISLNRARYEKKFDWRGWLLGLGQAHSNHSRYPDFLKQTKLNLQIAGSENILIDNNIVSAPVVIRISVVGTVERYGIVGRIESRAGKVFFRGNEFRIVEGSSMDFLDPDRVYPMFHIMAETYKHDYHVKLSIDGGPDNLIVTFFSDPPLPESDIISLLTFGHTGKGSRKGFGSGIAAGEATAMLTGGIQDDIEEELKGITGFEQIKFEPHTTSTGAFTSKVTVGKTLLEDRVSVTYSTAIGTTEEQIVKVEYKLSDEVSLVGSRDEFGTTGADLKYKLEFK